MKKYFKNAKGGALVMVLLVMVIMTILGTTLLSISLAENKQAIRENNRIEAYYLAKAGVEATASWILRPETTPDQIDQLIAKTSNNIDYGNGEFNVEVIKSPDNDDLVLIGNGIVNKVTSSTRMIIEKSNDPIDNLKFDYSVYLMNDTTYNGNLTIDGSLGHPEDVTVSFSGNSKLTGSQEAKNIEYVISKTPKSDKTITLTDPSQIVFDENIKTIMFANGIDTDKTIEIITGTESGEVNIVVNGNFIYGKKNHSVMKITGNKKLNIYVKDSVNINADVNIDKEPQKLLFLLESTGSFIIDTNVVFNGFVYAPKGIFETKGNANIKGAIIADKVFFKGTPFAEGYVFNPDDDSIYIPHPSIYSKGTWID